MTELERLQKLFDATSSKAEESVELLDRMTKPNSGTSVKAAAKEFLADLEYNPESVVGFTDEDIKQEEQRLAVMSEALRMLHVQIHKERIKEAEAKVEGVFRAKHAVARRQLVVAAVELAHAARAEQAVRDEASQCLQGAGSAYAHRLPAPALASQGWFNTNSPASGLAGLIRESVNEGFLTGNESYLEGIKWRLV
jgi:hypothetical protein